MQEMGFNDSTRLSIHEKLREVGLSDSSELVALAADFKERPEAFSSLLQTDFGFDPIAAHRTRAAVMNIFIAETNNDSEGKVVVKNAVNTPATMPVRNGSQEHNVNGAEEAATESHDIAERNGFQKRHVNGAAAEEEEETESGDKDKDVNRRPLFKSVVVNEKALKRRSQQHDYGLPRNYRTVYPKLGQELQEFETFMTLPSTASQEAPIRPATANVYMRHAKLFLGWFLSQQHSQDESTVSLFDIIPDKEKESAQRFLEFILWLRTSRNISVSYEANVLRGLTKLLKFRFATTSQADPEYGEKSFGDIPLIRELRKLHRDANKRQKLSPRSSDEEQKWLSWSEYLQVIQGLKTDLLHLIDQCDTETTNDKGFTPAQRKVATLYQHYLILSFLACVPDRQRTIRELDLSERFLRDKQNDVWTIKHGPDDYKTGKTYGDRPPLVLAPELVPAIDDFLERWRPCLTPKTNHLFVQPRTGNPLTQDSVYQIVARSCYKYSGKRTNPHLLRDMIVTHVRESDASEKQLEALALYMGHSISMQRNSYDRRTLTTKVAPAVELLQSVNKLDSNGTEKQ